MMVYAKTLTILVNQMRLFFVFTAAFVSIPAFADSSPRDWTHEYDELGEQRTTGTTEAESEADLFSAPVSWDSFIAQLPSTKFIKWGLSWNGMSPYEKNSDALTTMSPASTQKIITSTTALRVLGAEFRFQNSFHARFDEITGEASNAEFSVSGDPTWGHAAYGEKLMDRMKKLTDVLIKSGVKKVSGEISVVLTQPRLAQHERPEQWKQSWLLECYATLPTPVILNGNCATFKVSATHRAVWTTPGVSTPLDVKLSKARSTAVEISPVLDDFGRVAKYEIRGTFGVASSFTVPVQNNIEWLKNLFVIALADAKIAYEVKQKLVKPTLHADLSDLEVDLSSKTLREILGPFLEKSINLIGDRLYLEAAYQLGSVKFDEPQLRSLIDVTHDSTSIDGAIIYDGSGLISADQIAVKSLRAYLAGLRDQPYFNDFLHALPVAGKTGTIRSRLTGALTNGRVFAKTGTIDGVANLAGYFLKADLTYEPFVVFTHSNLAASTVRTQMDKIVTEIARQNTAIGLLIKP
jgi:D-alanyl-D-alanine carboxypeptidase/D-alanyl-D-alanine-endopeptidase (penicillin-binding protein 4)